VGQVGVVRRDPFAMLAFCGYNITDYFTHWLSFGKTSQGSRRSTRQLVPQGRRRQVHLAGYGENMRVLKWIVERIEARRAPSHAARQRARGRSTGRGSRAFGEAKFAMPPRSSGPMAREMKLHAELVEEKLAQATCPPELMKRYSELQGRRSPDLASPVVSARGVRLDPELSQPWNTVSSARAASKVSPICLGTMMFGDRTDAAEAGNIVASARDAGVNFIDTADVYVKGESERITGKLIAADRERWVLATKVANPMGEDPNRRGTGRKWVMRAIEESLERLDTDYVDIYYIHRDPGEVPMEETAAAMADLIGAGMIRYWGLSNLRGWRIAECMRVCDEIGVPRPVVCQPYYNAMNRQPENDILPACAHYGLGCRALQPARARRARRQVHAGRGAARGQPAPGARTSG
jgi:aryl-alcohol dehydrogenase-like predicted oxidoreductase